MIETKSISGGRKLLFETYSEFKKALSDEGSNVWAAGTELDRKTFIEYFYILLRR